MNKLNLISALCFLLVMTENAGAFEACAKAPTSSLTVNVRDKGARGDGSTNDSAAIQAALNQVAGTGGKVLVPDGVYMIDAVTGIMVGSDTTLSLSSGAIIKAIPNDNSRYSILRINLASNVTIIGGTLIGERYEHKGVDGEWGMGIHMRGASNVVIDGVTVKNTWGDGFYINQRSRNIELCSVTADNNRRQGMSITSADGVKILNSTFKNTQGTQPQSGIDLEPNENNTVSNVTILNSQFINNKGTGIIIYAGKSGNDKIAKNILIDGNYIASNSVGGIAVVGSSGNKITNNIIKNNPKYSIKLHNNTKENSVTKNLIINGREIEDKGNNIISENTIY
ncbi:right-handed parallel beta-helix repeat-containing protein [Geopseudomonas aromaticivorans]